ncbi:uncharacterized protein SCODWIG_03923 [Saccharomycodes ludwigii]|uniref:tRNA-splicing endonuclease subunit Sen34 n=1 Tax=Saccharomycodes ludwigii TaxID=36035 RepID=A0A376BC45_9ASCO|nr:uncharacterized protein SCODWIG_03923 [Saccharomycodes ludwigii]
MSKNNDTSQSIPIYIADNLPSLPVTNDDNVTHSDIPLLFDIQAIKKLRYEMDILGVLIGTLPSASQQNLFLSIPLRLMVEEAIWLVNSGKCYFKKLNYITNTGANCDDELPKKYMHSIKNLQDIELKKYMKRQFEYKYKLKLEKEAQFCNTKVKSDAMITRTDFEKHYKKMEPSLFIPISNTSSLIAHDEHSYRKYQADKEFSDRMVRYLYKRYKYDYVVYKHLREYKREQRCVEDMEEGKDSDSERFYISPGSKFGGRFIVYPGDPLRYHSHMIIQSPKLITTDNNSSDTTDGIDLLELVCSGRLGTGVKKTCVYPFINVTKVAKDITTDQSSIDNCSFYSIEWSGFG